LAISSSVVVDPTGKEGNMSELLFSNSQVELLKKHLQAVAEVEFLTIGLYLTGVYSFTSSSLESSSTYDIQQKALSVAVQEMYHLQLACNLSSAFGVTPKIPTSSYMANQDILIPHLKIDGKPLTTRLGNLPAVIEAMIAIEIPDPNPHLPQPNQEVVYGSIADLYYATLTLLGGYLAANNMTPLTQDPNFMPGHNQVVYGTFSGTYKHNDIQSRPDVAQAANAITDQGEGKLVAAKTKSRFFSASTDPGVLEEYQPLAGTRFAKYGTTSHFVRFVEIQHSLTPQISGSAFYKPDGVKSPDLPSWAATYEVNQQSLNIIWTYLVDCMQSGFASGKLTATYPDQSGAPSFNDAMLGEYIVPIIWQYGYAPSYAYISERAITPRDVQAAMDKVDPLCLFHWDSATSKLRGQVDFEPNACQGLNTCQGKGWGGIATQKGDGACATADFHSCGGNNECRLQGGCAFLSPSLKSSSPTDPYLPPSEQWIPGENRCNTLGGCQTPIAPKQVFANAKGTIEEQTAAAWNADAKQTLEALIGKNVWDHARDLFRKKEKLGQLPAPISKQAGLVDYDGTKRRNAIQATSVGPT
jgi:hypothetical protein